MLPAQIVARITQDDIDLAIPGTSYNSPVAKALKRQFPYLREAESFVDYICLGNYGRPFQPWTYIYLHHTTQSKAFEETFANGQKVGPATFELEVYRVCSWI